MKQTTQKTTRKVTGKTSKVATKSTVKPVSQVTKTAITVKPVVNTEICNQIAESIKARISATINDNPSIEKDTLKALRELTLNSRSVLAGIETIAKIRQVESIQLANELNTNVKILDKKNPAFIAQKVINKLFTLLSDIGAKNITNNQFAYGFLSGLLHETNFTTSLAYNYLSCGSVNDKVESERIKKNGGYNYAKSTASTQTSQMRQLARIFGLANTTKGKRNDIFNLNDNARSIVKSLLGFQS